ncbi:excinuclease ABC subunit UvrA, partial [Listeria monocytogenes]
HAGKHGGEIQFVGSYTDLLKSDTLTGQFLNRHLPINSKPRQPKGFLTTEKSSRFNLKNIQANIPKEVLTVITGVAGS